MIRRTPTDRERGAAVVEMVIVVPLIFTLLLGMLEIGMAWRANQIVVQAARGGARTVTQLGTIDIADQQAIEAIKATFEDDAPDIVQIIIFEAMADGSIPVSCRDGSADPGDPCNMYGDVDVANSADPNHFDSTFDPMNLSNGCGTGASANWCPSSRNDVQETATFVGVFVEFERDYITGFFGGGSFTMDETTVMRIEPETGP